MDIEKLIELANKYLSDYFWVFLHTLRKPNLYLVPTNVSHKKKGITGDISTSHAESGKQINPKLFLFVLISISISTLVLSLVSSLTQPGAIITKYAYLFLLWLFIGTLSYLFLRFFRRGVGYIETISLVAQLFSVIHVVSAFVALLGSVFIKLLHIARPVFGLYNIFTFIDDTFMIFYVSQALLTIVYLPMALIRIQDTKKKSSNFLAPFFVSTLIIILAILLALSSSTIAIAVCDVTSDPWGPLPPLSPTWYGDELPTPTFNGAVDSNPSGGCGGG